jgi:RsiW-degrading membrane proteinase PrsW (M82 family)
MRSDPALALSLSVLVALAYIAVLRLIDPYEKEPLWALCMMLFFGAVSAGAAALLPTDVRADTALGIALTAELSKALAIALGIAAFAVVKHLKGWSEINGTLDGVVYGAAAGLGFATGSAFVSEIAFSASGQQLPGQPDFPDVLLSSALSGLSDGIFGGIIGAGVVAALEGRSALRGVLLAAGGLLLAVLTHFAYAALADPGSPFDSGDLGGRWLPLTLSLAVLLVLLLRSAAEERRLARETREPAWLRETGGRRRAYLRLFKEGDLEGWLKLRALHSRQMQLAVAERRLRESAGSPGARRRAMDAEVRNLRASLATIESGGPELDVWRRLTTRRARFTACAATAALLAAGLATIALGAASERDARASAAERQSRASTGPPRRAAPHGGVLRDRVRHRIGPYLLVEGSDDRGADATATEAFRLVYATARGEQAQHRMARFPSVEAADNSRKRLVQHLRRAGWKVSWRNSLARIALLDRRGSRAVVWSNRRLTATVVADGEAAMNLALRLMRRHM